MIISGIVLPTGMTARLWAMRSMSCLGTKCSTRPKHVASVLHSASKHESALATCTHTTRTHTLQHSPQPHNQAQTTEHPHNHTTAQPNNTRKYGTPLTHRCEPFSNHQLQHGLSHSCSGHGLVVQKRPKPLEWVCEVFNTIISHNQNIITPMLALV